MCRRDEQAVPVINDQQQQRTDREAQFEFEQHRQAARRGDGHKESAQRTAGGHRQVEARQMRWMRFQARQFTVADHARREHGPAVDRELPQEMQFRAPLQRIEGGAGEAQKQRRPEAAAIRAVAAETDDERNEIERERQHPHHRYHGDVLRKLVRRGHQHPRAAGRTNEPDQAAASARMRRIDRGGGGLRCAAERPCGQRAEECEQDETNRPRRRLLVQAEARFHDERVGGQREQ